MNVRHPRAMSRYRQAAGLLIVCLPIYGCSDSARPMRGADESPPPLASEPAAPSESAPPAGKYVVGDEPAASLEQVAADVRAAFSQYQQVDQLIYPRGWTKYRPELLTLEFTVAIGPGLTARFDGIVRVTFQDRFSVIQPDRASALAEESLFPRTPAPTLEQMLDDRRNPPLPPYEITIHYADRDGYWHRTDWQGMARDKKGEEWLDRVGVP